MLAKLLHKTNIEKRKVYLFKQYINGMLSSKSSENSRAFGHPSRQHSTVLDICDKSRERLAEAVMIMVFCQLAGK